MSSEVSNTINSRGFLLIMQPAPSKLFWSHSLSHHLSVHSSSVILLLYSFDLIPQDQEAKVVPPPKEGGDASATAGSTAGGAEDGQLTDAQRRRQEKLAAKVKEVKKKETKDRIINMIKKKEGDGEEDGAEGEEKGVAGGDEKKPKKKKKKVKEGKTKTKGGEGEDGEAGEDEDEGVDFKDETRYKDLMEKISKVEGEGKTKEPVFQPSGVRRRLNQLEVDVLNHILVSGLPTSNGEERKAPEDDAAKLKLAESFNFAATMATLKNSLVEQWRDQHPMFENVDRNDTVEMVTVNMELEKQGKEAWKSILTAAVLIERKPKPGKPNLVIQALKSALPLMRIGHFDVDMNVEVRGRKYNEPLLQMAIRVISTCDPDVVNNVKDVVLWLLQHGASAQPSSFDRTTTPLLVALEALKTEDWSSNTPRASALYSIIWHLIERGASIDEDIQGRDAVSVAKELSPPLDLYYISNLVALAHSEWDASTLEVLQPFPSPSNIIKPLLLTPPPGQVLKDLEDKTLQAEARMKEEAEKKKQKEEEERKRKEEEAEKERENQRLTEEKKKSEFNNKLIDLFIQVKKEPKGISDSAHQALLLITDPNNIELFEKDMINFNEVIKLFIFININININHIYSRIIDIIN